jgi:signal transduction histidine kinase
MHVAAGCALAAAIALAGVLCSAGAHAQAEGAPHRIVVLNASDPDLPAFLALDLAMRAEIRARLKRRVEFHAETLDMLRFPGAQFEQEAAALLNRKYRDLKIDAIVAVETTALDFVERRGERLWPGAAIVFHSVPLAALDGRKLAPRTAGVPVRFEVAGTLDLALRLRPDARRVVVVAGTAEFDRNLLAMARAELARLAGRLQVDEVVGSPIARSLAAIEKLPPDSFVLYLSVFRDGAGMPQVPREVLRQIAAAANAPVFGMFETYLGEGIVAGSIASYEAQGRRAGELVARVLEGARAAELGVQAPVLAGCIADWRLLQRWSLDERRLPEGCEVRFREPSAWQLYRWQILGTLAVILLQGALIAALVVQRQRRLRAEIAVQRHRMELAHAGRLATAGELTAAIAHEVNQPLGAILANVDAAEMLLDSGHARPEELRQILADLRRDDLRANDVVRRLRALLAKQEMMREPLDLNAAIAEVLRLLETEARRRHVALAVEFDGGLPRILGDRVHLQQVLLNLIINAMDAMAETPADLRSVLVRTARDGHGRVEVSVTDRGHGIAPERLPRLFESFFTTKQRGMGLGLSIARSIVEAHGGRIWATSGDQGGATFRFTLPHGAAAKLSTGGKANP